MTRLDRLLAYVAPQWALRRQRARAVLHFEAVRADPDRVRWIDGVPWSRIDGPPSAPDCTHCEPLDVSAPPGCAATLAVLRLLVAPHRAPQPTRMKPAGGAVARCYAATRNGRAVLVVAPGPRLDAQLLDVAQIVPSQLPRRVAGADSGTRALLVRLLTLALRDVGLCASDTGRRGPKRRAHPRSAQRTAARRWLFGELDDQGVAVPMTWVCDVLGLEAGALAAAVRRQQQGAAFGGVEAEFRGNGIWEPPGFPGELPREQRCEAFPRACNRCCSSYRRPRCR